MVTPKTMMADHWLRSKSRIDGRVMARSMAPEINSRAKVVAHGPAMGKSWMANAAPIWSEQQEAMMNKTPVVVAVRWIMRGTTT